MHIFHKWSKWEFVKSENGKINESSVYYNESDILPYKKYVQQQKTCSVCNKLKIRKIYL